MKAEHLNALAIFEPNFKTAIESGFTMNISERNRKVLRAIYTEINRLPRPANMRCSGCIVNILKELGQLYYREKEKTAKREAKKAEKLNQIECDEQS